MRALAIIALVGCVPVAEPVAVTPRPALPPPPAQLFTRITPAPRTPLDEVALAAARSAADDYVVSARVVRAAMAEQLGSGLWPHVLAARGSDDEIAAQLAEALAELGGETTIAETGRAIAEGRAGRVGVIVALAPPHLPVAVERDHASARIAMPWPWQEAPAAFAITPTTSRRLAPPIEIGTRVELAVDCSEPATIEIRAGDAIVASVVGACERPIEPADRVDVGPPATTRIEREQRLFALINRERVAHDRAALAWDADVHRFARAHSADMARGGYVGHEAPDGAYLSARIARAPFSSTNTRENVGHAWFPGEAHEAFLASPGHRTNLLADDVERGAVGIVRDPGEPGAFYVTEMFRRP